MSQNQIADRSGELDDALKLGLTEEEFHLIQEKIGRTPSFTELAMFSGMWSEHCSYKNSILLLKELYCESDRLLAERGEENAGALRINDKQAVVFKIESHNHPSALEPYQGAATGVGGIMRDIFTMGARPLVTLNSLRFGMLEGKEGARNRHLLREVVKGIGDYGNSLGIPCAGGEIYFHDSYSANPLVNAMTVGIAEVNELASSSAKGEGNIVLYVGARTGRDGIHGASFASKDLSEKSEEERSAVQVGDPFMEKLVMEATLECISKGLVAAVQDMGAAGLLSSSSEMSSAGGVGIDLHLEKVPAREEGMVPFEFLLSESQERMLMVIEPHYLEPIKEVFTKWELECAEIGAVTDSKRLRVFFHGECYADLPADSLTVNSDGAPRYRRQTAPPAPGDSSQGPALNHWDLASLCDASKKGSSEYGDLIAKVMGHPNFASRKAVYEQYDTHIGNMRMVGPGQNAGLYRVPGSEQAIASCTDGNSFYVAAEPFDGARHTVAESFRNIVSSGAEPIGISNCLNFANPYKPENYYYFQKAVTGMSSAAQELSLPITGGNVSFYNESEAGPVLPTPTIGMVGLLEDYRKALGSMPGASNRLFLIGDFRPELESSQYYHIAGATVYNPAGLKLPELDLSSEKKSAAAYFAANEAGLLKAGIDLSSGGLLAALLRMLFASRESGAGPLGATIKAHKLEEWAKERSIAAENLYWGESAHCYLAAVEETQKDEFAGLMQKEGVSCVEVASTRPGSELVFAGDSGEAAFDLDALFDAYARGLSRIFEGAGVD